MVASELYTSLVWYKITITADQIEKLLDQYHRNSKDFVSFAIYLGTMGKGYAWVSAEGAGAHAIGRYWDIRSEDSECKTCEWAGPFFAAKCPVNCNVPSQSYYHIPSDWIIGEFTSSNLEIVLLEERGGDPTGVQLVLLN